MNQVSETNLTKWNTTNNIFCIFFMSDNVKALYRRAKAHKGAWNPDQAKADYNKCLELDDKLNSTINRELNELSKQEKLNDINNKLKFQKLFTSEDE